MTETSAETDTALGARRRILDVAAQQFRSRGYAGVSVRGIAAATGLRAASLYYHFPTKDDLVLAVLDTGIETVHEAVEEALAGLPTAAPAATRLRAAMVAHLQSLLAQSDYTSANVRIFGQLPAAVRDRHRPVRRRYEALWDRLIAEGRAAGALRTDVDPVLLRNVFLGTLNAALEWFRPERGDVARLAQAHADLLLTGVLTAAGREPLPAGGRT